MIAHVAEAGEGLGRVVLRYSVGRASPHAVAAAVRVAQAYQSEIESLFIEDTQLLDVANHTFAREMSFSGRVNRKVTRRGLQTSFRAAFVAARRCIEAEARAAEVPLHEHVVRDEPIHAIAAACAKNGPWNVVALAEPVGGGEAHMITQVFESVRDATGIVLAGRAARRTAGPVIVAVEDLERLPGMLRVAERLARTLDSNVQLVTIADGPPDLERLEGEIRLLLAGRSDVRIVTAVIARGEPAAAAEAIRRLSGGFLIARIGGVVLPADGNWRPLVGTLECPLFLVR